MVTTSKYLLIAGRSISLLVLLVAVLIFIAVPSGIRSLSFLSSDILNNEQDYFLHISTIKQQYPIFFGADIPITFRAHNAGKLPLTSHKMWLQFMDQRIWVDIPELEPGAECVLDTVLPYPAYGVVAESDKFVRVRFDAAVCNIHGFYLDIDVFAPRKYTKSSDPSVPELNVLVITSHKNSVMMDFLESVRALETRKLFKRRYDNLPAKPLAEESLVGTTLQPLFALQLWEVTSVEPLEKNCFFFDFILNGTWREHALYSLDNRLLKREAFKLDSEIQAVLFIVPHNAPSEVIRGVSSIWSAAEASNKYPLMLVINGTNPEEEAAKFATPARSTLTLSLNKSHHEDVNVLRAIHRIVLRGENSLLLKRHSLPATTLKMNVTWAMYAETTLCVTLVVVLLCMLLSALYSIYYEVRKSVKSKSSPKKRLDQDSEATKAVATVVETELVNMLELKSDTKAPVNAQGNLYENLPTDPELPLPEESGVIANGTENETSVILITLERLVEATALLEEESTIDEDDEQEDDAETETDLSKIQSSLSRRLFDDESPTSDDAIDMNDVCSEEFELANHKDKVVIDEEKMELSEGEEGLERKSVSEKEGMEIEKVGEMKKEVEEQGRKGEETIEESKNDEDESQDPIAEILASHVDIIENYASTGTSFIAPEIDPPLPCLKIENAENDKIDKTDKNDENENAKNAEIDPDVTMEEVGDFITM